MDLYAASAYRELERLATSGVQDEHDVIRVLQLQGVGMISCCDAVTMMPWSVECDCGGREC